MILLEKSTPSLHNNDNNNHQRAFNFVILGKIIHQSPSKAQEYIQNFLNQDQHFLEINVINIFNEC